MAGERSERVPTKRLDQRLRALRQANEIRSRRAALKKELASGQVRIEDVLARPPDYAKTAQVQDLLLALPKEERTGSRARSWKLRSPLPCASSSGSSSQAVTSAHG